MFRLLPWSSGIGGDKAADPIKVLGVGSHNLPLMDTTTMAKFKRKRTDSTGSESAVRSGSPNKKRADHVGRFPQVLVPKYNDRQETLTNSAMKQEPAVPKSHDQPTPPTSDNPSPTADPSDGASESTMLRSQKDILILRDTIGTQLNLSILLKHDELRLIEQEIGKCQIALEQLRRCHEIPFPGLNLSQNVSFGTGPSVKPTGHPPLPTSPAPWGVTNGPYSRHYAKWLLPDPSFDGGEPPQLEPMPPAGKAPSKARSTRGSFTETIGVGSKSRGSRGSTSGFQALSSGYPQPKAHAGPMILKRKSDGMTVKLVCLECRRDNFSSAQGFINHCRIAHGRSFASHDAAADACGEVVETDESGVVVGSEIPSTSTANLVHPLIRTAHSFKNREYPILGTTITDSPMTGVPPHGLPTPASQTQTNPFVGVPVRRKTEHGASQNQPTPLDSIPFQPSPLTPNLSSLLRGRNIAIDLAKAVADAKTEIEFEESSSDESESDSSESAHQLTVQGGLTLRGGMSLGRTTKSPAPLDLTRKGPEKPQYRRPAPRKPEETSLLPTPQSSFTTPSFSHPPYSPKRDLQNENVEAPAEPSPTNDSNQAPSLVSDSSSDASSDSGDSTSDSYEAPASETSGPSGGSRDTSEDLDVEVEDYDVGIEGDCEHGGPSRTRHSDAMDEGINGVVKQRRASALKQGWRGRGRGLEKHVSFVSPSPSSVRSKTDEPKASEQASELERGQKKKGGRGRRKAPA